MQKILHVASTQEQSVILPDTSSFPPSTFPDAVIDGVFAKICFLDNNLENMQKINTLRNNRKSHLVVRWKPAEELGEAA